MVCASPGHPDGHQVPIRVGAGRQLRFKPCYWDNIWTWYGEAKTLTNTEAFPFNNSAANVSIATQANANYLVFTEVVSAAGNVGEVIVSNKTKTGFTLEYTGSASTATIKYTIITGFAS